MLLWSRRAKTFDAGFDVDGLQIYENLMFFVFLEI